MAAADGSLPLRTRDAPSMVGAGWLAVGAPTVGCSAPCVPSPAASCASGLVANGNDWRGLTVLAAREPFRPLKPESRRAAPPCALYTSPPSGASLRWVALVRRPDRPSRMLLVIASTLATRPAQPTAEPHSGPRMRERQKACPRGGVPLHVRRQYQPTLSNPPLPASPAVPAPTAPVHLSCQQK
eukprot:365549-Chlamydomonas_euryale.AAC.10